MATLLDRDAPLDAVFCFNDTLALGALGRWPTVGCAFPRTSP
jgi:DNA-binding LacI/PurR family transcriptional regulator